MAVKPISVMPPGAVLRKKVRNVAGIKRERINPRKNVKATSRTATPIA